ncbi:hypothetical protein Taro_036852 [Colocasia esculenta]|uniref:Uncharacterized protein n=1 Tax=Colocasia esculenta TaxID=4460 RepID=A0A843W459_COLES|nr:hypothetical protein [Colocasia esculenta]
MTGTSLDVGFVTDHGRILQIVHAFQKKSNSEFKKYLVKPFPYKRQLDILCGNTTVQGSHFMGSTQEVDVEARRSFGDDDSVGREQFNAMGLESSQFYSIDGDNFNPFDFPLSSQPNPPSRPVGEKTPTNIYTVEDEATSPARRRNDHASICSRKRKSSEEELEDEGSDENIEDEEALLSRRLQCTLAKKKYQSGRRFFKNGKDFKKLEGKDVKKSEPICYKFKKPGHIKANYPNLKKTEFKKKDNSKKFRRYKKKTMAAAWNNESDSNSESSSSDEEEEKANMAFMANTDEKERFTAVKTKLCGNKRVDIADLDKNGMHSIVEAIERMKWSRLVTVSETSYPDLVKAFYTCLKVKEDGSLSSSVKGTPIHITYDLLESLFGVSTVSRSGVDSVDIQAKGLGIIGAKYN